MLTAKTNIFFISLLISFIEQFMTSDRLRLDIVGFTVYNWENDPILNWCVKRSVYKNGKVKKEIGSFMIRLKSDKYYIEKWIDSFDVIETMGMHIPKITRDIVQSEIDKFMLEVESRFPHRK